jgi:hypothetical protein
VICLLAPWWMINSLQNTILLTFNSYRKLSITTFASSLIYVLILSVGSYRGLYLASFCLAYIFNFALEHYMQNRMLLWSSHES